MSSYIKRYTVICYAVFSLFVAFLFIISRQQLASEGAARQVEQVTMMNNWILPDDHPYQPFLRANCSRTLNAELLHFLRVSRFRAFPHRYDDVFMELLTEFDRIWRQKLGRSYFIMGGTLLGAVRHGSWLPYDDDLDVVIDTQLRQTLLESFNGSRMHIWTVHRDKYKLYFDDHRTMKTPNASWPVWPFLDVFFYDQRRDGTTQFIKDFYEKKLFSHEILPTIDLPFHGRMFSAPRCPLKVLERLYGDPLKTCCVYSHNHRTDSDSGYACIECTRLAAIFPYLKWNRINNTHAWRLKSFPPPNHDDTNITWHPGKILKFSKC